ncbi:hypothetical protein CAP40_01530 [Sphingomonas sp. IBVSS2]|uniref:hypothetical protein n=1 Tax=Sphingomonas sp. IBVSS2 TaxID=1985172 RepID=UPI000A2D4B4B|nr:hypothetical protein [Sphingomonas sp. IBVSS2]OSZ69565.1 hypothetical protein CAP40_01530 [Sphingomonas sp. IBVSS2]
MSKTKGRPKGSERNGSKALNAVADMIHADPALKPTTAMRRHNPKIGEAEIRRLQVKWKERNDMLLAAAWVRAEARQRQVASTGAPVAKTELGAVAGSVRMASAIYNSPEIRIARELQREGLPTAILEGLTGAASQTIREALNSPAMEIMRQVQNDPTLRIMREIAEERARINRALGGW